MFPMIELVILLRQEAVKEPEQMQRELFSLINKCLQITLWQNLLLVLVLGKCGYPKGQLTVLQAVIKRTSYYQGSG